MEALWCLLIFLHASAINGQSSWNPSSMLSRVPGLHPVGGSMNLPQFLAVHRSYSSDSTQRSACPQVNKDCPKQCRKADSKRCRICDCSELKGEFDSCLKPPTSCPKSCRKLDDKGCKICSCKNEQSASMSLSSLSGSSFKKCSAMLMCMLSCKQGYTLGSVTNEHGCQTCTCTDNRGNLDSQGNNENGFNTAGNSNTNSEQLWTFDSISGNTENGNSWKKETENTWSHSVSDGNVNKGTWESGSKENNSDDKKDVWSAKDGVGESSSSCSGPLCPGNSGGMNPMFPGAISGGGSSSMNSGGCQGPFCAGQGGMGLMGAGMGGAGGSGSSGCSGPFCTMSSSASGMGGASGGGMGGIAGGMGGASGGGMGGPGGVGAFSPFGLAAGSKTGARGESSGCSGPFCTMSTGNSVGGASAVADMTSSAADESFNDGQYSICTGPSCTAKNGDAF